MKLAFVWEAVFEDGIRIRQFDDAEQTGEHLFKEIQEKEKTSRLVTFSLIGHVDANHYSVDLVNGVFYIEPIAAGVLSRQFKTEPEVSGTPDIDYRLIYFRRVTRQFSAQGKSLATYGDTDIQYFLGYQYTDKEGKNHKRLMQIDKAGRAVIV